MRHVVRKMPFVQKSYDLFEKGGCLALLHAISCLSFIPFRFRAGIKDLEVMMQNVITTAFETVTTVPQGVELLDAFQHLSAREVYLYFIV